MNCYPKKRPYSSFGKTQNGRTDGATDRHASNNMPFKTEWSRPSALSHQFAQTRTHITMTSYPRLKMVNGWWRSCTQKSFWTGFLVSWQQRRLSQIQEGKARVAICCRMQSLQIIFVFVLTTLAEKKPLMNQISKPIFGCYFLFLLWQRCFFSWASPTQPPQHILKSTMNVLVISTILRSTVVLSMYTGSPVPPSDISAWVGF